MSRDATDDLRRHERLGPGFQPGGEERADRTTGNGRPVNETMRWGRRGEATGSRASVAVIHGARPDLGHTADRDRYVVQVNETGALVGALVEDDREASERSSQYV